MHLEIDNLEAGDYYLLAEVDWTSTLREFVLTAYGAANVTFFEEISQCYNKLDMLQTAYMSKILSTPNTDKSAIYKKSGIPGKKYMDMSAIGGYCCVLYVNNHEECVLKEELTILEPINKNYKGCKLLGEYEDYKSFFVIKVAPKSEKMILVKICGAWKLRWDSKTFSIMPGQLDL